MKEILIFAGTTEGRALSEALADARIAHTMCVATEYGEIVLKEHPLVSVHRGRMNQEEIRHFLEKGDLTPTRLELPLMLWGNEMVDFNVNLDIEVTQLLGELGYILIATKDGYEWWCLDSQSGEIVSYTDDDDYSDIEDCCNKETLFERHGFVKYNSFNDFLQACFLPA